MATDDRQFNDADVADIFKHTLYRTRMLSERCNIVDYDFSTLFGYERGSIDDANGQDDRQKNTRRQGNSMRAIAVGHFTCKDRGVVSHWFSVDATAAVQAIRSRRGGGPRMPQRG